MFKLTYQIPCNQEYIEYKEPNKGYRLSVPDNLFIPPGLPCFYGFYDLSSKVLREPNEYIVATEDKTFLGVFNVYRQIQLYIVSQDKEYRVNFPHLFHGYSFPIVSTNDGPENYGFYAYIPHIDPLVNQGYTVMVTLQDANSSLSCSLNPYVDMLGDKPINFVGSTNGDVDINALLDSSNLALLYNGEQVYSTIFGDIC